MELTSTFNTVREDSCRRFFKAVDELIMSNKTHSLTTFCDENGLQSSRYREMKQSYGVAPSGKKESRYKYIEIEGLFVLVAKYKVSADWLIRGVGSMFRE